MPSTYSNRGHEACTAAGTPATATTTRRVRWGRKPPCPPVRRQAMDQGFGIQFWKKNSVPSELGEFRSISVGFRLDSWEYSNFEALNLVRTLPRWVNFGKIRSIRTESQNPAMDTGSSRTVTPAHKAGTSSRRCHGHFLRLLSFRYAPMSPPDPPRFPSPIAGPRQQDQGSNRRPGFRPCC